MIQFIIYLLIFLLQLSNVENALYPPSFVSQPEKDTVYYKNEALILHCKATGNPIPSYTWYRYGREFNYQVNVGRYAKWPNEGTLILATPGGDDDGIYYCTAQNDRGIAVSVSSNVRRAEMQDFYDVGIYDHNQNEGTSLKLLCKRPVSYPPPIVTWEKKKDGRSELLKDSNKYVTNVDGYLYITRLTYDDDNNAEFTCTAYNQRMRLRKTDKPHKVTVARASQNIVAVHELYRSIRPSAGKVGGRLELQCILGGNPEVNYRWYKVGMEGSIIDRPNIRQEAGGPYLVIDPVTEQDGGNYQCIGENEGSTTPIIIDFLVQIVMAPRLITKLSDQNLPLNGSVKLSCSAVGIPEPIIYWTVNGKPLSSYLDSKRMQKDSNNIYINKLQDTDRAVFQCNATNPHGYDLSNGYVNVMQDKPEFMRKPEPIIVKAERTSVVLPCETFSAPRAVVSWSKDGYPINGGRYIINQVTGNLEIDQLITADSGEFTCLAKNIYGSVTGSTKLFIRQKTQIMIKPVNTWVYFGQEVKFVCTARTDRLETQNLRIDWYLDNQKIDFTENSRIQTNPQDNSLIIMGAETTDNGIYTCNATNGLDFDVSYASLVVQGPPFNPSRVSADCNVRSQDRIGRITWVSGADNYAPVIKYMVEYSTQYDRNVWYPVEEVKTNSSSGSSKENVGEEISIDIHLRPNIDYRFRVRAKNRIGISEPSETTQTLCKISGSYIPTKNPEKLYVYSTASGNLVIQWTPLPYVEHNGGSFGYEVKVNCLNCESYGSTEVNTTFVADWSRNQLIYINFQVGPVVYTMEKFKLFKATIQSRNEYGNSKAAPTEAQGYSGDDVPSLKIDDLESVALGKGYANLSWTIIPENNVADQVKGLFRGYRMEWCYSNLDPKTCNDTRQYQDLILQTNTMPVVYNSRKKRSINLDVTHVDEFLDSSNTAILKRVKRQSVYYNKDNWSYGKKVIVPLSMLPGDANIKIWVRVLNNLYAGPQSNIIALKTHEDTPGPVTNFRLMKNGINHVVVGWEKPAESNGKLTGFRLGWREIKNLELGYMTKYPDIGAEEDRFQMSGLKSATKYRILIWALTSQGEGVDSFIDVMTLPANIAPNPPRFNVLDITLNNINLSFVPSEVGVKGSVFFAQYRKYGQYRWDETEPEYINQWIYIQQLANDTEYGLRVVATNGAGMSTPSEMQTVRTKGRRDPTRLVNDNAIWFICVIIILILTICLMIFLIVCRDRRMAALIPPSSPQDKIYEPYTVHPSEMSGYSQNKSNRGFGSPMSLNDPIIEDEPDFPLSEGSRPTVDQQSNNSLLNDPNETGVLPQISTNFDDDNDDFNGIDAGEEQPKPKKHKKKRKHRPKEDLPPSYEDVADDTII